MIMHMMEAAEIDALVYDPTVFDDHAAALKDRIPNLKLLSFGPSKFGLDYLELSENFSPAALSAPDVNPDDISSITLLGHNWKTEMCYEYISSNSVYEPNSDSRVGVSFGFTYVDRHLFHMPLLLFLCQYCNKVGLSM